MQRSKNCMSCFRMMLALAAIAAGVTGADAQIPDAPGWKLVWHDEFNGDAVDTDEWDALDRQNSFNNELQYYRPEQASIVDGKLRITATNQPLANKPYRSARLESKQAFAPGRFEARIDLPTTQGMWPAFWLLPIAHPWPTRGEIDIMENRGSQPFLVSSAYHWQTNPGPCCNQHQYVFEEYVAFENGQPVNFHSGFHTYGVEWEATQLRFYVDGVLHYAVNETANRPIFETPMNIILNLAVGGDFGGNPNGTTVFPQFMDVEYVRVWERQSSITGDYNNDGAVDAADFVVWSKMLNQSGIGLSADASGNGTVGPEDYDIWLEDFTTTVMPAATSISDLTVPEPVTVVPIAVGLFMFYAQRLSCFHRDK
jgi:beta-glucanase (GH16 family)